MNRLTRNTLGFMVGVVLAVTTGLAFAQNSVTNFNIPVQVSITPTGVVTVTIQPETYTATTPCNSATTVCTGSGGTTTPPVTTPPVSTAGPTSWVYHANAFLWPGDWSGAAVKLNYADTVGLPGGKDLSMTTASAYGYWLPYPPLLSSTGQPGFNTTGYNNFTISIKATAAGQKWSLGAFKYTLTNGVFQGDITTGTGVSDISTYCKPAIAVGVWSVCTVPLSAIGAANLTTFYKFIFQDQSGKTGSVTYINNVGFTP